MVDDTVTSYFLYNLIAACILLFLPLFMAFIHRFLNHQVPPILLYFRYFVFFNTIIFGLIIAFRIFLGGVSVAASLGWYYNHIFEFYAASLLGLVFSTFILMWGRKHIILAMPLCWDLFFFFDTLLHLVRLGQGLSLSLSVVYVHVAYQICVIIVLTSFIVALRRRFSDLGVIHHGREAYTA